ncbi:chromatin remodeling complex Adenosinetriphosphatase [Cryomyces antarcticus]|uniref:Chromatin remodeling complex Adenosinetriphosphatase n=1 Tax=Cryomyces antarcticus TaxID=329879 RepID=A0ABR0M566_9PEZI|nr:chromatin remodeling complex Adenosinetriphosphatase [Cryomyces antarcticus]
MDKYYRNALMTGGRTADTKPKTPRAPKQIACHDYQFFPARLSDLQEKETAYFRKTNSIKAPLAEGSEDDLEERERNQQLEQQEIDDAEPLTEAEAEEKENLSKKGFADWNKRDFQQFINGSAKYGRTSYEDIATEVDSKTPKEIREYAGVFWKRYQEIANWQKHISAIEEGEDRAARIVHQRKMLAKKMAMYRVPLQQLKINYSVSTTNKKVYTEEEDRFLLVMLDRFGIDSEGIYERIRDEIRESPLFRFDWFFLSRTPIEISRRCTTLLTTVGREFEGENGKAVNGKGKRQVEEEEEEEVEEAPAKKKMKNGVKNKQLDSVKGGVSKATSATSSRAGSVASTGSAPKAKGKGKKK